MSSQNETGDTRESKRLKRLAGYETNLSSMGHNFLITRAMPNSSDRHRLPNADDVAFGKVIDSLSV